MEFPLSPTTQLWITGREQIHINEQTLVRSSRELTRVEKTVENETPTLLKITNGNSQSDNVEGPRLLRSGDNQQLATQEIGQQSTIEEIKQECDVIYMGEVPASEMPRYPRVTRNCNPNYGGSNSAAPTRIAFIQSKFSTNKVGFSQSEKRPLTAKSPIMTFGYLPKRANWTL